MVYILFLAILELFLFVKNYIPGTYLIGWDNLMPEFNFWLNLKRSLMSVWQEYRGLGLYDGMAHAANLMHTVYIWLLSFIFPSNMLRYVFILLTHLSGGIAFFFLAKKLIKNDKISFIGALFYMLNLGIVQMYSAPLEVFVTHFAALPLLLLITINALEKPGKRNYFFLFLISIFVSPQGFVPTVFIAFFILFFFVLFFDFLYKRNINKVTTIFLIVLIANLFWLLPFMYGAKTNSQVIQNTRINQYSSEEIYNRNKAFGNLTNVMSFKGFMMDGMELDTKTNTNGYLLDVWRKHSNTTPYKIVFGVTTLVFLFGLFKTLKNKKKELYPFLASLIIAFFFLANNTLIFKQMNDLVRYLLPTIGEAFRFPFTKFIILFTFCYSVIFAYGLTQFIIYFQKQKNLIFVIFLVAVIYLGFPAFRGYLISPYMRQQIPLSYIQMFNYFNNIDENKRIAFLPAPSFWNWENRSWGQRGSGFLWYGIPQAIMLRAFDPWSQYNEQFYNEISYAQKTGNIVQFNQVLKKYNIDYLLLDKSIINSISPKPIDYDTIEKFMAQDNEITKDKVLGQLEVYKVVKPNNSRFIYLLSNPYTVAPKSSYFYEDSFYNRYGNYIFGISTPQVINVLPSLITEKTQNDLEFSAKEEKDTIIFTPKTNPFSNLTKTGNYTLTIPPVTAAYLIPAKIEMNGNSPAVIIIQPTVKIDGTVYSPAVISIPLSLQTITKPETFQLTESNQSFKLGETFYLLRDYPNTLEVFDSNRTKELTHVNIGWMELASSQMSANVGPKSSISIEISKIQSNFSYSQLVENKNFTIVGDKSGVAVSNGINIKTNDKKIDLVVYKDNLPHQSGYIVFTEISWKTGLPLDFYVDNPYAKRSEMEAKIAKKQNFINVFFLPPTQNAYSGYGFHFVADPVGKQHLQTTLKHVEIYPIPYEVLKGITMTQGNIDIKRNTEIISNFEVDKSTPYLYLINLKYFNQNFNNSVLTLSQSFSPDWKAYEIESQISTYFPFLFGKEIKEHVLVNNWANGWTLRPEMFNVKRSTLNIVIIFWPQYLEFIGFALLIPTFLFIIIKYGKTVISSDKKS